MSWLYANSATVSSGSISVSVSGNVDFSKIKAGWALQIGSHTSEVKSGTAPDGSGNSSITLAVAWDGASVVSQPAKVIPTSGALLEALEGLNETNDYAISVHKALSDVATLDADVTLTDAAGVSYTFSSMPKNARLVDESIERNNESYQELTQNYNNLKEEVKSLIGSKNLLPDPAFIDSNLGLGAPGGFVLNKLSGAVATVEVAELTESDKVELATVLGNSKAFVAKESSAFYEGSIPRKIIINQTVGGSSGSSLRFSCPVSNLAISPLYMKLVKMGAITKKTGEAWMNGAQSGMYFSKGDIDDNKVFQLCMNGVSTWEIFMPWLVLEADGMIYSNF